MSAMRPVVKLAIVALLSFSLGLALGLAINVFRSHCIDVRVFVVPHP